MTRASITIDQRRSRGLALYVRQVTCPFGWRQLVLGGTRPAPARLRAVIAEMTGVNERELLDPKATMPPVGTR
jgi:hypothetical protein